jgi:hypothetical protein
MSLHTFEGNVSFDMIYRKEGGQAQGKVYLSVMEISVVKDAFDFFAQSREIFWVREYVLNEMGGYLVPAWSATRSTMG